MNSFTMLFLNLFYQKYIHPSLKRYTDVTWGQNSVGDLSIVYNNEELSQISSILSSQVQNNHW